MIPAFCPHCGYDLRLDTPILIDDFSMLSSVSPLFWRNQAITLTGSEKIICYTLMKSYPQPVRVDVLHERLDSEAIANVIDVYVCRIRRKLREIGAPNPIRREYGRLLTWVTGGQGRGVVTKKAA